MLKEAINIIFYAYPEVYHIIQLLELSKFAFSSFKKHGFVLNPKKMHCSTLRGGKKEIVTATYLESESCFHNVFFQIFEVLNVTTLKCCALENW